MASSDEIVWKLTKGLFVFMSKLGGQALVFQNSVWELTPFGELICEELADAINAQEQDPNKHVKAEDLQQEIVDMYAEYVDSQPTLTHPDSSPVNDVAFVP